MLDPGVIKGYEALTRRRLNDVRLQVETGQITKDQAKAQGLKVLKNIQDELLHWTNTQLQRARLPQVTAGEEQAQFLNEQSARWYLVVDGLPTP